MISFGVLGPLTLTTDIGSVEIGTPKVCQLLAALLCRAGQPVRVGELLEELWEDGVPPTGRKTLQGYVHRLRNALGDPARISHGTGSYAITVKPEELDALSFADLAAAAHRQSEPGAAATLCEQALELWRGPAYTGVCVGPIVAHEARRLDEERLLVRERLATVELHLGRHAEVATTLPGLIHDHPFREGLRCLLMIALYRSGRRAEALEVYRRARALLAEQLGIEPGPGLQRLHHAVLAGDDRLIRAGAEQDSAGSAGWAVGDTAVPDVAAPRELPADAPSFVGRDPELAALRAMLPEPGSEVDAQTVVVTAIGGTAGVGKTALAIRWAHEIADRFPDGQLFIDLRGYASVSPLRPVDALAAMLRSLGISSDRIPPTEAEAAALYRSQMSSRRMLVVLDNARSAEQVRPLLPGGRCCMVLITSRSWLGGLIARDGARHIALDVLPAADARELLARLIGEERVRAEPDAVDDLARACGNLPLALRIAAAQLDHRPHQTVAEYVATLTRDRLATLAVDEDECSAVRGVFDQSFRAFDPPEQRLFRLLGHVPGRTFDIDAVAALAAIGPADAAASLRRLADAHLLTVHGADRYGMHDLLREYAAGLANGQSHEPLDRLLAWYLDRLDAAARAAYPTVIRLPAPPSTQAFPDRPAAMTWLTAEHANLAAAVSTAATTRPQSAALIADGLRGYYFLRRASHELLDVTDKALSAVASTEHLREESALRTGRSLALLMRNQTEQATPDIQAAAELSERAGWWDGHAQAQTTLSRLHVAAGRIDLGVLHAQRALGAFERVGHTTGQGISLGRLALCSLLQGQLTDALRFGRRAMVHHRASAGHYDQATTLINLAETLHLLGRPEEAMQTILESLDIYAELDHPAGEAPAQTVLAILHRDAGQLERATTALTLALQLIENADDHGIDLISALGVSATLAAARGDFARADRDFHQAVRCADNLAITHPQAETRNHRAEVLLRQRRLDEAVDDAQQALSLALTGGYRLIEALSRTTLAEVLIELGQPEAALGEARLALRMHRRIAHPAGIRRASEALGRARAVLAGHARSTGGHATLAADRTWSARP